MTRAFGPPGQAPGAPPSVYPPGNASHAGPLLAAQRSAFEPARWFDSQALAAEAWRPELERLIDRLGLQAGDAVLDAGCGGGHITRWLAQRVAPAGRVSGVDADETAVARAAWALQDLEGRGTDIELRSDDIRCLPYGDDHFDAAWCSSVLGYLADPIAALRELVRVVRPGGRVLALTGDAARWTFWPIDQELEARLRAAERRITASRLRGLPLDLHLGRRLYSIASRLPVTHVEAVSVVWERTAPLTDMERRFLRRNVDWLTDPAHRAWLGADWHECCALFGRMSDQDILRRPDLHVVQTASVVVLTV